jgi:hypothetical protein
LMVFSILDMLNGNIPLGVVSIIVLAFCGWYYVRAMKRRENAAAAASGGIAGNPRPYADAPAGD